MTKPKPPPVHPHAGEYQVVVSFRVGFRDGKKIDPKNVQRSLRNLLPALYAPAWLVADLSVAVREIGPQGEIAWDEGRKELPA
jgi:hypothetical protein